MNKRNHLHCVRKDYSCCALHAGDLNCRRDTLERVISRLSASLSWVKVQMWYLDRKLLGAGMIM